MCENNIQHLQVDEPALCFGGENAELRQALHDENRCGT